MKEIQLTQGKVALVDDDWYKELNKFKWYAHYSSHTKSFYAERKSMLLGKQKTIRMHRIVAGTHDGMQTDHIDGDTLNNQSDNLRTCTRAQNLCNSGRQTNNTSDFKGIRASGKKWRSRIRIDGKLIHLGYYLTPEEAARAYDEAAKELHGEFARLNFPND